MMAKRFLIALIGVISVACISLGPSEAAEDPELYVTRCTTDPRPVHPPCTTISGRLVDRTGNPVANARVTAYFDTATYTSPEKRPNVGDPAVNGWRAPAGDGVGAFAARDTATTDASGNYTLHGLYAGEVYWLKATPVSPGAFLDTVLNQDVPYDYVAQFGTQRAAVAYAGEITAIPDMRVFLGTDAFDVFEIPGGTWAASLARSAGTRWQLLMTYQPFVDEAFSITSRLIGADGSPLTAWDEESSEGQASFGDSAYTDARYAPRCGYLSTTGGQRVVALEVRLRTDDRIRYEEFAVPPCPPAVKPVAPTIRTAQSGKTGGTSGAKAYWYGSRFDGGSAITAYIVTALRVDSRGHVVSRRTFRAGSSARSLTVRVPKGRYRFQVRARSAKGDSANSRTSNTVSAR